MTTITITTTPTEIQCEENFLRTTLRFQLLPRSLEPADYAILRTALKTLHEFAEKMGPEKVSLVIGVSQSPNSPENDSTIINNAPTPIFRLYADKWGCEDCKVVADKWALQAHHCSGSRRKKSNNIKKKGRKQYHYDVDTYDGDTYMQHIDIYIRRV